MAQACDDERPIWARYHGACARVCVYPSPMPLILGVPSQPAMSGGVHRKDSSTAGSSKSGDEAVSPHNVVSSQVPPTEAQTDVHDSPTLDCSHCGDEAGALGGSASVSTKSPPLTR